MNRKMMKLIFYSGGDHYKNRSLDHALLGLLSRKNIQMTYIPYSSEDAKESFGQFRWYFNKYRVRKYRCFQVDQSFLKRDLKGVLKSDIIYLSGGNTYYFLKSLRRSGLIHHLREYVKKGGVLAGTSAGAIMMTPNINTASLPSFDTDDNEVNLRNLKSLNLVKFEFSPHYRRSKRYDAEMKSYSKKLDYPVYACTDGSGIVINDNQRTFVGNVVAFIKGQKLNLTC